MAGYTLIGGTAHKITGGKTLIGGTVKNISGGKTLIGGTGYDIKFLPSLPELMATAVAVDEIYRDSSSQDYSGIVTRYWEAGTYYVFSFYLGYMGIYKVVRASDRSLTLTYLNGVQNDGTPDGTGARIRNSGGAIQPSKDGRNANSAYAYTVVAIKFPSFSDEVVDSVFSGITLTKVAGRDSSSTGVIEGTSSANMVFVAGAEHFTFNSPVLNSVFAMGTYGISYYSLLMQSGSTLSFSITGSTATKYYGASIVAVS